MYSPPSDTYLRALPLSNHDNGPRRTKISSRLGDLRGGAPAGMSQLHIQTKYGFRDYFRNSYARNADICIDHFPLNAQAAKMLALEGVDWEVRARRRQRTCADLDSTGEEGWTNCKARTSLKFFAQSMDEPLGALQTWVCLP
jgi:hypothetical protein